MNTTIPRYVDNLPISLGSEEKSLRGTGIFFVIYSHTTSILYFNCADIGMMGAPSAMVPEIKPKYKYRNFQILKKYCKVFVP